MERTLEELQQRAQDAIRHSLLVALAKTSASPNAAHDLALEKQFSPRQAKSCRFLSMIKRDYGQEAFDAVVSETHKNDLAQELASTITHIKLVEDVTEWPLLISGKGSLATANEKPMRLAKYLEQFLVTGIMDELQLAGWRIDLSFSGLWFEDKKILRWLSIGSIVITSPDTHTTHRKKIEMLTDESLERTDLFVLRKNFFKFLRDELIGHRPLITRIRPKEVSLIGALCQEAESLGTVLPPNPHVFLRERKEGAPFWDNPLTRGDAETVQRLIDEKRVEAAAAGVTPNWKKLFEYEAQECLEQAKNAHVPYEVLDESSLGGFCATQGKTPDLHFLLFCPSNDKAEIWTKTLRALDYCNVRIEWSAVPNRVLGNTTTPIPRVILLHNQIGFSDKHEWADRLAAEIEKQHGTCPPIFTWDGVDETQFRNQLAAFLHKHCPLP